MSESSSRRSILKTIATALASASRAHPQNDVLNIAGRPIELTLTSISPHTLRLTIHPIENGTPLPVPQRWRTCPATRHREQARLHMASHLRHAPRSLRRSLR